MWLQSTPRWRVAQQLGHIQAAAGVMHGVLQRLQAEVSGALQLPWEEQPVPDFCVPCPSSHVLPFYSWFHFYQALRYQICLLVFMFV